MPQLIGLTYAVASEHAAAAGLHLEIAQPAPQPSPATPAAGAASSVPAQPAVAAPTPSAPAALTQPVAAHPGSIITAQTPQAGRRVQQGDAVHVSVQDASQQPLPARIIPAN